MQKAFSYLRVSGKGQIEGDGFTRQRAAIKAYAAKHAIKIVREFREEGVSGTVESMNRPAFSEMMTALHGNGVRTVLIERLDRLSRDVVTQEVTIRDMRRYEFSIVSVAEPDLMENDPSRKAFRQMMGVFAEFEKDTIVAKLRGARMRKKATEGRCEGRKPYGHFEGEGAVIERMKALRAEGLGFDRIAAAMNAEGIATRTRGRWHGVMINRILSKRESKAAKL
jgi:site-specific DNA recombinase